MTLLVFQILKQKQNKRKTRGFLKSQFAHFREKNKMFLTDCHFRTEGGV